MKRDRIFLVGALIAALPACTGASTKTAPDDQFASIVDPSKADFVGTITGHPTLIGSLDYGQTSAPVSYKTGRLAFKFGGAAGDQVNIWVRSNDGDAVAYLYTDGGKQLGMNDDADGSTLDSHISAKLVANTNPDIHTYYIVFRDYDNSAATFTVSLAGPGCDYNGSHYNLGQSFPSSDGCNTCSCNVGGGVACTKRACINPQGHSCGGNIVNNYQCPTGFKCIYHPSSPAIAGAPGNCEQTCGGIAGRACSDPSLLCTDDWSDSCDPAHGGADCGGICETGCTTGQHYDTTQHKCVADVVQGHTCGGNIVNNFQCPTGYKCVYHPSNPAIAGAPGNCEQTCGGFGGFQCTNANTICTDDWSDSCDPAHGGADCGGICETACAAGQHYDTTQHKCVADVVQGHTCGGNIVNNFQCPTGYKCVYHPSNPAIAGAPGNCEQTCGGFGGFQCTNANTICTDDWSDSCDPAHGGADCGGICETGCAAGQHYDTTQHKCVANVCVQTQLCTTTSHWDSTVCACVPNTCVQHVLCTTTSHFDNVRCMCVPN